MSFSLSKHFLILFLIFFAYITFSKTISIDEFGSINNQNSLYAAKQNSLAI